MRVAVRATLAVTLLSAVPLLAIPLPGRSHIQRGYCRLMLRALGMRITVSGGPIRNLRGVLVVSGHVSWVDIFSIGAVMPGSFVAKAELISWPGLGIAARLMKVIPIERGSLRHLPDVVGAVAARLHAGQTVVAFPEGTTWCGLAYGPFRRAMFQAAVDAGRPVQPLRLNYHHRDGKPSTWPPTSVTTRCSRRSAGSSPHAAPSCTSRSSRWNCRATIAATSPSAVRPPSAGTRSGGRTGTHWSPDGQSG